MKQKIRRLRKLYGYRVRPRHIAHSTVSALKYARPPAMHRRRDVRLAVVIHLYHADTWEQFRTKLDVFKAAPFDLFVTIPQANKYIIPEIQKSYENVFIWVVPNRGRDVLPFMKTMTVVLREGYEYVLKIHSKKSTHRTDGDEWLTMLLDGLIPTSVPHQKRLVDTLQRQDTGIIGPDGQYYALSVNFTANGTHMEKLLGNVLNKKEAHKTLHENRDAFGFFGGTMFWARVDAIAPLVRHAQVARFETEAGQLDATYAHAVERLLCIVPEVMHKQLYAVDAEQLKKQLPDRGIVPDWSGVYIGPKAS